MPGATVTLRNVETNATRTLVTDGNGGYRFLNIPVGNYELTVELSGFSQLRPLRAHAVPQPGRGRGRRAPARGDHARRSRCAPMRRCSTRPTPKSACGSTRRASPSCRSMNSRDIFTLAASAPGVSAAGQRPDGVRVGGDERTSRRTACALRSNNFMIDGQDSNDPSVTGRQQPINNTDIVQEDPADHEPVRGGVRPRRRIGDERGHQERDQRVPRVGVRLPQRRHAELAQQPGQGGGPDRTRRSASKNAVWRHAGRARLARIARSSSGRISAGRIAGSGRASR